MRSLVASVSIALVVAVAAPALAQAPPPDSVTQVLRQKVVPGMTDKYEAGRKKHMAWHKAQGDPWAWNVYEITTGPDTGGYIIASPNHQWADIDTWTAKYGDADTADAGASMAGTQASSQLAYWTQLNSLSRLPPADSAPTPLLSLTDVQREARPRLRAHRGDRQAQRRAECRQVPAAQHLVQAEQRRVVASLRRGHPTRQPGHLRCPRARSAREAARQGRYGRAGRRSSSTTSPGSRRSFCRDEPT